MIRELAEWFKATSLKLVKINYFHGFKSHTLCIISLKQINYFYLLLLFFLGSRFKKAEIISINRQVNK